MEQNISQHDKRIEALVNVERNLTRKTCIMKAKVGGCLDCA